MKGHEGSWVEGTGPIEFSEEARAIGATSIGGVADDGRSDFVLPFFTNVEEARGFRCTEPFVMVGGVVVGLE